MTEELIKLKAELQQELDSEQVNFEKISDLNERLLALDPRAARFTVDAQHIHRLGFELVGKQETALSELIKNAYDADATYIDIDFQDYSKAGGRLIISDDGNGMTEQEIREHWMHLSTSDKENNPLSPFYGRSRAGRKGIGRFAVERLGQQLLLETKKRGETKAIRVHFEWDKQYQSGKLLTQITNILEQFPSPQDEQGTKLIIGNLRDKWTKNDFIQVWKFVLLLQPPFEMPLRYRAPKTETTTYPPDPGFKVRLNGELRHEAVPELSIEKTFLAKRTALIKGWIDAEGNGHFYVRSEVLELEDMQDSEDKYQEVGPLEFEVSYFIYDSKLMPGFSVNTARKFGKKLGGIRVYRDGFRVLPYGESNDDWLQLATIQGNKLVPINHYNFFGHVALTSAENPFMEETASREGLIENDAYKKLRDFIHECLEWAVLRVASSRHSQLQVIPQTTQEALASESSNSTALQKFVNDLPQILKSLPVDTQQVIISGIKEAQAEQSRQKTEQESERRESLKYAEMLRVLASIGISIAVFSHETLGAVNRLRTSLNSLRLLALPVCEKQSELQECFAQVENATNNLNELASYVVTQMDHSGSREKNNVTLYGTIKKFVEQFEDYLKTRSIAYEYHVTPDNLQTAPMHRSEIDSVLFNFLTNALKAMERDNPEKPAIKITATKRDELFAVIRFQDTGKGVSENLRDRIFHPFFTTIAQNQDEIAGPGCGLGLKIVSDIASANRGFVRLSEPETGYGCCFEFGVPISSNQMKIQGL